MLNKAFVITLSDNAKIGQIFKYVKSIECSDHFPNQPWGLNKYSVVLLIGARPPHKYIFKIDFLWQAQKFDQLVHYKVKQSQGEIKYWHNFTTLCVY